MSLPNIYYNLFLKILYFIPKTYEMTILTLSGCLDQFSSLNLRLIFLYFLKFYNLHFRALGLRRKQIMNQSLEGLFVI